jgi:hypothetical protein
MNLCTFEQQIEKTGFCLEYRVGQSLEAAGWEVINNKYYLDDRDQNVREIDIVAYKAAMIQHFVVYTTLIVSCKKSDSSVWALLSKNVNPRAVNVDWWPLHIWTNDKAIDYQLAQENARRKYQEDVAAAGVANAFAMPAVDIFAFQEMNRVSGAPQNDKAIFAAMTSLMKAQAYELNSLPKRRKAPAVYQFNLLSVVDTDLVRLHFSNSDVSASPVDSEHYIARYILGNRETFARIRFLTADGFAGSLPEYTGLHRANCQLTSALCDAFYDNILSDWNRTKVWIDEFRRKAAWFLNWRVSRSLGTQIELGNLSFSSTKCTRDLAVMEVSVAPGQEVLFGFLNEDAEIRKHVSGVLKEVYRFQGQIQFVEEEGIPF